MAVEWEFRSFGPCEFRVWRSESCEPQDDGTAMAKASLIAEQPEGDWRSALQPFVMSAEDVAYHAALVRQKDLTS